MNADRSGGRRRPFGFGASRPLKLVGAHLDITDQKRAEEAMQESEGRLRVVADALPFLISYLDSDQMALIALAVGMGQTGADRGGLIR
jgi:PAS domain-containing protein